MHQADKRSCVSIARIDEREIDDGPDMTFPEKELLRSILVRAIQDATGNISIGGERVGTVEEDAIEWFKSKDHCQDTHITFEWLCEVMGIDSEAVRKVVFGAREKGTKLSVFDHQIIEVPYDQSFHFKRGALL